MDRQAAISVALAGAQFQLDRLDSVERLSESFVITAEGFVERDLDFLPHLGKPVSIDVADRTQHVRYFHGRLTEATLLKADINGSHYRLTLRPWFHLLDHNRNYRIFQDKSVVDIARLVFADLGMNDVSFDKLTGAYPRPDYCVQYRESDFNFLSRLFENAGIYYYYVHTQDAHTLVLCDGKSAHRAAPGYDRLPQYPVRMEETGPPDTLWSWNERVSTASQSNVVLRSFDFKKSQNAVHAESRLAGQHPGDSLEVYDYSDSFIEAERGEAQGALRLAAARARRRVFRGGGDALGLACGGLFTLTESTIARFNREYLITGLRHIVEVEGKRSGETRQDRRVEVEAIPSDTAFRPPHVAVKPVTHGIETATVTGPAGEVIFVDEFGRVKVRFHWDRSDEEPGKTSCWMRVSHHAAGQGFGNVDLPRVGQEVIVDFLAGDPDRPIITGRVYNGQRPHAYGLPGAKTRSLWRTQTVGDPGSYDGAEDPPPPGPGFNEIRLEDAGGSEEIYVHAQREMLTEVLLDDRLVVKRDRKTRIGRDRTTEIKHDETVTVEEGNETRTLKEGSRETTIKANDTLTLQQGNFTMKVEAGTVTIDAATSITLKVGDTSMVMDTSSITLKSQTITTEAETLSKMKGGMIDIEGSSLATMKAAMININ